MPSLFPSQDNLVNAFSASGPFPCNRDSSDHQKPASSTRAAQSSLYTAWSVADDAKNKAAQLSDAAVKELEKSSAKVQEKTGKIELYSPKFYAASVFGGLMACVGLQVCPG